ncbi:hypothetical protein NDU88_004470 [Pleurodeles waltl]|uniref:Uncharacterized protein n=1 Tax=Pleurodeles waltl TaxID=8319 RepID=A0AAV7RJP4_PLEWA|nr:hypothetical protein NDU88_004470 [Pleurodeles waltl]
MKPCPLLAVVGGCHCRALLQLRGRREGKRDGPVEGCWQGGTVSPASAGEQGAVPVKLIAAPSARPLRLGFRGRGSATPAVPLSPMRAAGHPVFQRVPSPGAGDPEHWEGLRDPPRHSSLQSASRPRGQNNANPSLRQASTTEARRGSSGSRWRALSAQIRSLTMAEGADGR